MRPGRYVQGDWSSRFTPVVERLKQQVNDSQHHGVALTVTYRGEVVVDVWAGAHSGAPDGAWQQDSMAVVFSATKVVPALIMLRELERASVSLDTPVADVWPSFSTEATTMAHVLTHSAGIPHLAAQLVSAESLDDWDAIVETLAGLTPLWEPGTRHGYHALSFGWLAMEIARRVAGRDVSTLVDELRDELDLDGFYIGVPKGEQRRVAPVCSGPQDDRIRASDRSRRSLVWQAFLPLDDLRTFVNSPQGLSAVLPSVGGAFTARSLSRLYGALVSPVSGSEIVSARVLDLMSTPVSSPKPDLVMMMPLAWTHGALHRAGSRSYGNGSFGYVGFGGSTGFADRDAGFSFGLVCTQGDESGFGSRRAEELAMAVYGVLR